MLLDILCSLLPSQFDVLIVQLGAPAHHLAGPSASLASRAVDLLRWADQQGRRADLERLCAQMTSSSAAPAASPTLQPVASSLAATSQNRTDVLVVTVTKIETQAVLQAAGAHAPPAQHIEGRVYFDLGEINGARVRLTRSEMGTGTLGGAHQTVTKAITALSPAAVIMVGIAFGLDDSKQQIGDILVTEQLRPYDLARVSTHEGKATFVLRGDKPHAAPALLNLYKSADLTWTGATVRFGTLLTGDKLVDNLDYRAELRALEPEAIGGEMEGTGLYLACHDAKVDWILVKGICDWADGNKAHDKDARQALAAKNAAELTMHALRFVQVNWGGHKGAPAAAAPAPPPIASAPQPALRRYDNLTGAEMNELSAALLSAFPSRSALARMLRFSLDKNLDAVAAASNLSATVFELLIAAAAEGWMSALVEAAHREVP
ncbi:MAG: effector-associated domain EAD1-containing protein, partial [Minicystis sp.]